MRDGVVEEAVDKPDPDVSDTSSDDLSSPDSQTQEMINADTDGRAYLKAQRVESLMYQRVEDEMYVWDMPPQSSEESTSNDGDVDDDDSFGTGNYVDDEESFGSDN